MKYSMLLVAFLSATSLFGADSVQAADTTVMQQTNAELAKVRAEAIQAKEEVRVLQKNLAKLCKYRLIIN